MTSGFDPMGGDEFPRSHPIPSSLRDASSTVEKVELINLANQMMGQSSGSQCYRATCGEGRWRACGQRQLSPFAFRAAGPHATNEPPIICHEALSAFDVQRVQHWQPIPGASTAD
jgi:hypothetical protein